MPTVQELYELWADDTELRAALQRSLEPRGTDWLFEAFGELGPQRGQLLVDVGARDARHAVRLVREHGLRAVALDPVPLHAELARAAVAEAGLTGEIDVVVAAIESMPLTDATVDWIWCRDVLVHVDAHRGLAECARVLRPGGAMLAYATFATERLEPREAAELTAAAALTSLDPAAVEAAAGDAGLVLRSRELLGSEWRERMLEDGAWNAQEDLLHIARLRRQRHELAARYGGAAVDAALGGLLWGIYQLLGKLRPSVYVWERRA
ncbi:MAG: class I SAM-dependent methyltransferase [Gaiellaceae bacterium]